MKFKSVLTGKSFETSGYLSPGERSAWLFTKKIIALDRFRRRFELSFSFLTLTQSDESVESGYRWVSGVMDAMKKNFVRRGLPMKYVAVLEIQPKRYAKFQKLARHWHVVVACDAGTLPHGRYSKVGERRRGRLEHYIREREGAVITFDWFSENWKMKHGQYFVCDSWSRDVVGYLKKYLAKDGLVEELKNSEGRRIRKFSSSRFELDDSLTDFLKFEYSMELGAHPDLKDLYWRAEGSKLVGCGKEVIEKIGVDGRMFSKTRYPRVRVIRGEWVAVASDEALPDVTMVQG